jgi:hypothetical protein
MRACEPIVRRRFGDALTAVVYSSTESGRHRPEVECRSLDGHYFEWNIEHVCWASEVAWDLDGVLCRDFTQDEDDDGVVYLSTMRSMEPTHWCQAAKPKSIITARIEQYRETTAEWLSSVGVECSSLIMGHWPSRLAREADDVAKWKAWQLKRGRFRVYVESSDATAEQIATRCAAISWPVPVVSLERSRVFEPVSRRSMR